jgi:hypothetical protein
MRKDNRMRYAPIRGVVWWAPHRAHAEQSRQAARPANSNERASEAFGILAGLLARDEYASVLSQWKNGLREIWLDNGFVMMRYTPPSG